MAKKPTPPKPGVALKKGEVPKTPEQQTAAGPGRDAVTVWGDRLRKANDDYDAWAREYMVKRLAAYYRGHQWAGVTEEEAKHKYTINLTFATVETQLPTLMFSKPKIMVEARPARGQSIGSDVGNRATLVQDALQTAIDDPKLRFKYHTTLALRNAYSRFSVVEVGYTADWIDNPNAGKPVLKEDNSPMLDSEGVEVKEPTKVLKSGSEALYVRRVPPQSFRVWPGRNDLAANDFVAYFEWHYVEDVKRNPDYEHTADLKATGMDRMDERGASSMSDDPDRLKHVGMIKLWKIWDLRRKVRHVYAEGATQLLQEGKSYTTLPFAVLKFYELEDSFYPLPPIFNWLSPQDEVNESREMQKIHRRRALRRYMREPQVKKEEFEKLETGEDMVCIEVPKVVPSPIMPIPDAPLENANWQQLAVTHEDFREITGASGESRGEPTADTATQANIINVRQQIRESFLRSLVADWLGQVARLMLLTMREKMQEPLQVRRSTDPFTVAAHPELAQQARKGWEEIDTESIADLDVDISVDVASLSPVVEDQQRQSWDQVLMLLTNQQLLMLLMTPNPQAPEEPSPLLRKTLALHGIKSDQEVREIWRVGQQALQTMLLMAAAAVAAKGGAPGTAGMPPPGGGGVAPLAGSPARPPSGLPAAGPAG